jgi:chemosensory pili system protein ChpC
MAEAVKEVRGLLIPLQGMRLVLPDSVILQILTGGDIVPLGEAPSWMLGILTWQKRRIPVVSFELAANQQYERAADPRIMVLKALNNIEKMPFYAITLAGIPRPFRINEENITVMESASRSSPLILNEVLVEGEPTSIPNIEAVEEMLFNQYGLFNEEGDETAA